MEIQASAVATLTVNAASAGPSIATQPVNQTVTAGQSVSFSVAATGAAPLNYQWKKNGMDIAGATAASLTIPAAITPDCGAAYSVVVNNSAGSVTSTRATLTVNAAPGAPIILTNPMRARVLTNQTGTFSVTARSRTPMTYQWQKGTFTANMTNIPGAMNATYATPLTSLADHLTLFRCVVSNAAGNATSALEMLFVTTAVKAPTDITSSLTAFGQTGVPFSYTIVASGGTTPLIFSASPLPDGLSLDSITGVISGTPTAVGTTRVTLSASNSAGSGPTRILMLTVTETPPAIPMASWRSANFGASAYNADLAGDLADPDGDGVRNLLEYAAGTDPFVANRLPWSFALENGFLTASFGKNPNATNLTWGAMSSSDLKAWNAADLTILQDTASVFEVRDNFPSATNACRFLRLMISAP